jgi:hypothetical protein
VPAQRLPIFLHPLQQVVFAVIVCNHRDVFAGAHVNFSRAHRIHFSLEPLQGNVFRFKLADGSRRFGDVEIFELTF